jgi:hypothetical protein
MIILLRKIDRVSTGLETRWYQKRGCAAVHPAAQVNHRGTNQEHAIIAYNVPLPVLAENKESMKCPPSPQVLRLAARDLVRTEMYRSRLDSLSAKLTWIYFGKRFSDFLS